jgi:hypothetical protein
MKYAPCAQLKDATVVESRSRASTDNISQMRDLTSQCADGRPYVERPSPAGLIGRTAQGGAADPKDIELSIFE